MKKLVIFLIFSLLSMPAVSGCIIYSCSTPKTKCVENEILGKDGQCYSCFKKEPIEICSFDDEAKKKCPNRYLEPSGHFSFLEKTECPQNHFMADDGKCYSCDYSEPIGTTYLGDKMFDACPNRLRMVCGNSVATCPSKYKQVGKSCIEKCAEGYIETKTERCIHTESGDCYVRSGDGDSFRCSYDYLKCKEGYKKTKYGECINSTGDCYTEDRDGKIIECTFAHE